MKNIEIKKVASANEAIAIINRLNYMDCTFEYRSSTFSDDHATEYRHFSTSKSFAIVEIVQNDKLAAVRFFNLYRDITVELQLTEANINYDRFDNIINVDAEIEAEIEAMKIAREKRIAAAQKEVADYINACMEEEVKKFEAEVKAMLAKKKAETDAQDAAVDAEIEIANNNNVETITKEEPKMTIETKITASGKRTAKVNGKTTAISKIEDLTFQSLRDKVQVELIATDGHKFICTGYEHYEFAHPLCKGSTFNFIDDNGETFSARSMGDAIYTVDKFASGEYCTRNIFTEYAVSTEAQDAAIEAEIELANVEVQPKRTRKLYTFNAPQYTEDDPVVFNRVDIRIDGNRLTIDGIFRCQNVETAYCRFQKCMSQAAAEIPQLEGWDNWLDAKKLTQLDSGEWINENEDIIFGADCVDTIAVDTNEDLHYIYGNFTNAFTSESATLSREDETPANNEPNLETKSASDANEAITILKSLEPKNHLRYEYICDAQVGEITYRHFASIDTKCGATPYRLIEVVINGLLESVMLIDTAHGNAGTKITFDRTANNNPPAQKPADDEPPADNFTEMRSKLHAAVKSCQADVDRLQNELAAANDNLLDAEKNLHDFLDAQANQLTSDLHAVIADKTIRYYRAGAYGTSSTTAEGTNIYIDAYTSGFDFTYIGKRLATYDTPAQVKAVIARIKETIERGESEFTFPTADELNPPTAQTVTEQLAEINSTAPDGLEIYYDAETKTYPVVSYSGKFPEIYCELDSLALYNILTPYEFWKRIKRGCSTDEEMIEWLEKSIAQARGQREYFAADESPDLELLSWLDLEIADRESELAAIKARISHDN